MIAGVKMKALVSVLLVVLVVLGCGLADGTTVSKCELRDQLEQALGNLATNYNEASWENLLVKSEYSYTEHFVM